MPIIRMQRLYVGGRLLTLSTYPDFSFRDEWAGLFFLDEKIANYLAIRTEWGWTAPENCILEKTKANKNRVAFTHSVNGQVVQVSISHRMRASKEWVEIRVEGAEEKEAEVGICGRHIYGGACTQYLVGQAAFAGKNRVEFFPDGSREPVVKEFLRRRHKQGDKEFEILVANIPFKERLRIEVERHPPRLAFPLRDVGTSFHSNSSKWNRIYSKAVRTIELLGKRGGWYAGLPWFMQYWGRDTFISLPALIREGYAPLARKSLLKFIYSKRDGEIPRLIQENGVPEFGSIDTNPLFLNALMEYSSISGDGEIISGNKTEIIEAFAWMQCQFEEGLPKSRGKDTWMDTVENRKFPIEVAAYTVSSAKKLASAGIIPNKWHRRVKTAWNERIGDYLSERSANILLASVYGAIPAEDAINWAREWEIITEWGVRSLSPSEAEYNANAYHRGAVWGLTTAAGLYVALKARDWETVGILVDALIKRGEWSAYLDEVWDANTGASLGADAQLWTAAMVIRAIDEVMIDCRCIPPDINRIERTRWEYGRVSHISVSE